MADSRLKRFRLHVVKEIYETERDYTRNLEFTVAYLLEKARQKGQHDNSFSKEIVQTLFSNIEDILSLHQELMADLDTCMTAGPSFNANIAQCYLKHREQFGLYKQYGEDNEHSQKLLYELEEKQSFKAFFVACMLLGGRQDDSIGTYLFKPIQRVCKYPLLFRELEKYTPQDHPDHASTIEALSMMRQICSEINEARRRVEKLEAIADWQGTVEGWEGSNVVDTCNELIREGPLIKISAGNTQERMFFLFDNLLVYCKKSLLSRTKALLFRGRVPVESLDIENIEDGTADYHTNGISVTNSWKVHNVSKNKWFVLIARSAEDKQHWMEAIRREKGKRKRLAAGIAQDTRRHVLEKGEKLYQTMKKDGQLIRDHRSKMRAYAKCFSGEELVQWLLEHGEGEKEEEAVRLGQALLENGLIHHVNDKHQFKKSDLLYRFRYDDGTFRIKYEGSDLLARGLRMYCRLHGLFDPLIRDQKVTLRPLKCVIHAQRLLEWCEAEGDIATREEGVAFGQELYATGILRHATDDQNFKDGNACYRFTADDIHEGLRESRKHTTHTRVEFTSRLTLSCLTLTLPFFRGEQGYGIRLSDTAPLKVKFASQDAQLCGVCVGQTVVAVNGLFAGEGPPPSDLLKALSPTEHPAPPLYLTVVKTSSVYCTLTPSTSGLGFNIKGNSPVVIHSIERGSAAAEAGILSGACILRVGDKDVMKASHDTVVGLVKDSLTRTAQQEGRASIALKFSFGSLEQLASFRYNNSGDVPMDVVERTLESPYTFTLPAQLLKMYASEAEQVCAHLSSSKVKETKVLDYVTELKTLAISYKKASSVLSGPRYPSYKPHGPLHSSALQSCPTNLHTSSLSVITGDPLTPSTPSTPSTPHSTHVDDCSAPPLPKAYTRYFISTMATPSLINRTLNREEWAGLSDAQRRRDVCHELHSRLNELLKDQEVLSNMVSDLQKIPTHAALIHTDSDSSDSACSPTHLTFPNCGVDDLTPTSSPVMPQRGHRQRLVSVSNPEPVMKLVVDGFMRKVNSLVEYLDDEELLRVVGETARCTSRSPQDTVSECKQRLKVLCEDLKRSSKKLGEALTKAADSVVETARTYLQDLMLHILISVALCDNVDLLQCTDQLFMQCLTAVVTAFAHHLMAAARGQLNPTVEYQPDGAESSNQWLRLVAKKGVLVHLQSTMMVQQPSELSALWDLLNIAQQLKNVRLHVTADSTDARLPPNSGLPQVSLEGDRSDLHVTFHLPPVMFSTLPEPMRATMGIRLQPVLFNKSLMDLEEGSDAYCQEKQVNEVSLLELKKYYHALRAFHLDRSQLPADHEAMRVAIHHISLPFSAMDTLVHQLEIAIREPTRPGVGLLTIAAELAARIGALRINICNSGVFRSGVATSLEHVMVLSRCHGLPMRIFRSALNTLRRNGSFSYVSRKNNADIATALPRQPPKLYQLPSDM